jgi:two-component system, OmpR family, sensor histidine kinase KdpD
LDSIPAHVPQRSLRPRISQASWSAYALLACAFGLAGLLVLPLPHELDLLNAAVLLMLVVVLVAARSGRGPAVLSALLGVAALDFFFVPPRFSFAVSHAQYLVIFAVLLVVALIIGQLTASLQLRAREAQGRAQAKGALYELAGRLAGAMLREQVDEALREFCRSHMEARHWLVLPTLDERLEPFGHGHGPLGDADLRSAAMAYAGGKALISCLDEQPGFRREFLPLAGATRCRGVLVVSWPLALGEVDEVRPLLEAVASLATTALERLHFVEVAHQAQLDAESERLRSSILSALSHDVRTPLTALYGLADTLVLARPPLADGPREIAGEIRDQALRLNGMVGKLLDMARLQSGRIKLRKEWQSLEEVLGASLKLLGRALEAHPVTVRSFASLPLVSCDAVLLERVFCNLLENAAKYSPAGAPVLVSGRATEVLVEVRVLSGGAGFDTERLEHLFEIFERGRGQGPGVGLGLAICRTIIEAHGGSVRAFNPPEGGACVAFTLPASPPPPLEPELLEGDLA